MNEDKNNNNNNNTEKNQTNKRTNRATKTTTSRGKTRSVEFAKLIIYVKYEILVWSGLFNRKLPVGIDYVIDINDKCCTVCANVCVCVGWFLNIIFCLMSQPRIRSINERPVCVSLSLPVCVCVCVCSYYFCKAQCIFLCRRHLVDNEVACKMNA